MTASSTSVEQVLSELLAMDTVEKVVFTKLLVSFRGQPELSIDVQRVGLASWKQVNMHYPLSRGVLLQSLCALTTSMKGPPDTVPCALEPLTGD